MSCGSQGKLRQNLKKFKEYLFSKLKITKKHYYVFQNYVYLNAQVETKDLENLILEVGKDIERMMDRKSDAIKVGIFCFSRFFLNTFQCIIEKAENVSVNWVYNNSEYQYYSSKYSNVVNDSNKVDLEELSESLKRNEHMYLEIELNHDTHFYNLPVDTSRSSVHVPTNIFDRRK